VLHEDYFNFKFPSERVDIHCKPCICKSNISTELINCLVFCNVILCYFVFICFLFNCVSDLVKLLLFFYFFIFCAIPRDGE